MTLTNAQAALQASVALHARQPVPVNTDTRERVKLTADAFLEWLEKNSQTWPNMGGK